MYCLCVAALGLLLPDVVLVCGGRGVAWWFAGWYLDTCGWVWLWLVWGCFYVWSSFLGVCDYGLFVAFGSFLLRCC